MIQLILQFYCERKVINKMFVKKNLTGKFASVLLATAPMLVQNIRSLFWFGEPQLPTKFKK